MKTVTDLAREARRPSGKYRHANERWLAMLRSNSDANRFQLLWARYYYRGCVMAPIREYTGRLRERIEPDERCMTQPGPARLRWRKECTEILRDEWRKGMREP
jgi:hypothetical protein